MYGRGHVPRRWDSGDGPEALSLQAVRSGKRRRAISVLRVLMPGVSGFRFAGHGADKLVVRKGRRGLFKYCVGRGGKKATLAVVHMCGAGLQLGAVMRGTGEKQGK